MDRTFLLQKEYIESRDDLDGGILYEILSRLCRRNGDKVCVVNGFGPQDNGYAELKKAAANGQKPIPVGSIEFVNAGLDAIADRHVDMHPLEIPPCLAWAAEREYFKCPGKDIPKDILKDSKNWFIKDASHLKKWNSLLLEGDCSSFIEPETEYVVSRRVEFLSEWRVFVCRGEAVSAQYYLGKPLIFPDSRMLYKMAAQYHISKNVPASCTFDVGVFRDEQSLLRTALIEAHPFAACGLYGFADEKIPDMLEDGIRWYLNASVSQTRQARRRTSNTGNDITKPRQMP